MVLPIPVRGYYKCELLPVSYKQKLDDVSRELLYPQIRLSKMINRSKF